MEGMARELARLRALQGRLARRVALLEARQEAARSRTLVDPMAGVEGVKGEVGDGEEAADEQLEREANELLGNIQDKHDWQKTGLEEMEQ